MITAIDTNILIDILEPDPEFGEASKQALRRCLQEGSVGACEVVWAEVVTAYSTQKTHVVLYMAKIDSGISAKFKDKQPLKWHRRPPNRQFHRH